MTTTTVGALSVKITADAKNLNKELATVKKDLKLARKSVNDNAAAFAKWSAAGVTAAAAIGAAVFKMTANNVREIKNLAFAANTLTQEFQQGAFAAQQFGIEQEKYGDILKDVNDRIGDFVTTGAGPMVDFFEQVAPKVGITADAFRGLSGQDALGLFISSLEKANLSQEEMTFHMEALASDATMLLPLFENNAEALNAMTAEAQALGIGLSDIDATQVEEANKALDSASAAIGAIIEEAAAELAPVIQVIAESFTDAAKEGEGFANEISFGADLVINSIGFIMDAVEGVSRAFEVLGKTVALVVLGIEEGMLMAADFIVNKPVEAVNELIDALNTLPWHNIDPVQLSGFGETIKTELDVVREAIQLGVDDIAEIMNAPMPSEGLKEGIEAAKIASQELADLAATNREAEAEKAEELKETRVGRVNSETEALLEAMRERFASERELEDEKFALDQEALAANREANLITDDEHNELLKQRKKEHEDAVTGIKQSAQKQQEQHQIRSLKSAETLLALGGKKTEKITKGLAIAQAVIKGKTAAVSAYESGMAVGGPFAPATAALYAAASIAQTASMIQSIKSSGKSAPRPSGAVPSPVTGPVDNGAGSGDGAEGARRIDINIAGEGFFSSSQVRQLIEQINEQTDSGVQLNATVGA